jgi:NAD(P)-dependent dehydrogenase (short-subunit alcohol dehydrogenase family)
MKTFIVTGATQGLGLVTAQALARNPGHHVVIAVRDEGRGREAAAAMGGNVTDESIALLKP